MDKKLEERLRACKTLPTLPGVALRLVELCQDPDVDIHKVVGLIQQDPALSAKILKTANSAFYARQQVSTLSRAVMMLGTRSVLALALSFSLVRDLKVSSRVGFDYTSYWRRTLLSAACARLLANRAGLQLIEEVFLAGLLQDIGMLALAEAIPQEYAALLQQAGDDHNRLLQIEREVLGSDHGEVSAFLAQTWRLPELVGVSARASGSDVESSPAVVPTTNNEISVACVAASGWLADVWLRKDTVAASKFASECAKRWLNIDGAALNALLNTVAADIPRISSLFEVDLGSADSISTVLDRAREVLVEVSLRSAESAEQAERARQVFEERSRRDGLTGLFNRTHLAEMLAGAFARAATSRTAVSVLFCDIDFFKKVNDTRGHQGGDAVLVAVAKLVAQFATEPAVVSRYGGEEFVLLLEGAGATPAAAAKTGERIREAVAKAAVPFEGVPIHVTISVGVACHEGNQRFDTPDALMAAADAALYQAKGAGRNRVMVSKGPSASPAAKGN